MTALKQKISNLLKNIRKLNRPNKQSSDRSKHNGLRNLKQARNMRKYKRLTYDDIVIIMSQPAIRYLVDQKSRNVPNLDSNVFNDDK